MIKQYQPEEDNESADRIAEEISASRRRIDAKLATLAESLSPQHLIHSATERVTSRSLDQVVDGVGRYYNKARVFIRRRPLGSLMLALGIAVLAFESMQEKREDRAPHPKRKPDAGLDI